ncbi:hypothetical protein G7Y89_g13419 [Cudoniella acicularis]|uniref:Uncharacterized protein n=1 Tax=Cudoniella acicularis TaxID=354080 RepID=A0A8H4VW30_9HELO|nr:hypothetical protein G7Y89_g13419 [Cudoniella acicularis]
MEADAEVLLVEYGGRSDIEFDSATMHIEPHTNHHKLQPHKKNAASSPTNAGTTSGHPRHNDGSRVRIAEPIFANSVTSIPTYPPSKSQHHNTDTDGGPADEQQ